MSELHRPTILVCDDDELIRWALGQHLENEGYNVLNAADGREGFAAIQSEAPACVVLDLHMPHLDGLGVLRKLRESGMDTPVIVVTSAGGIDSAIEATRLGAAGYLSNPVDRQELSLLIEKVLGEQRLRQEVHYFRDRQRQGYGEFIGSSPSLKPVFDVLLRLETVDIPTVLILGESGTGKDVIARSIHARGPRRDRVFMEIDCASLTETLIESELFGHERGAFTDAKGTKRGLLESAAGGVVFLDEIGEMSLATQAKLLRALENRTFKRVGGVANLRMDCAVIAATNRDLKTEVAAGRFREDLFFRLNVVPLRLPALRERREDIPSLAGHFLEKFARSFGRPILGFDGSAMAVLQRYRWPGNVRELRNILERVVILAPGPMIRPDDLPAEIRWAAPAATTLLENCPFILPEDGVDLEAVEKGLLVQALQRTEGNRSAAAKLLGISRHALRYRLEKFGLDTPDPPA